MFFSSVVGYILFLFGVSGVLLLMVDGKVYEAEGMVKERKVSRVLGWVNLALTCLIGVVYFIYFSMK